MKKFILRKTRADMDANAIAALRNRRGKRRRATFADETLGKDGAGKSAKWRLDEELFAMMDEKSEGEDGESKRKARVSFKRRGDGEDVSDGEDGGSKQPVRSSKAKLKRRPKYKPKALQISAKDRKL